MTPAIALRRSAAAVACVATLLFAVPALAQTSDDEAYHQARQELRETKAKIRERAARLRQIDREMNQLATEISRNEQQVNLANVRIGALQGSIDRLEARADTLAGRLSDRNREAFITGPGAPILYLMTATSVADAANRMSILTEMNRRDGILAAKLTENDERLDRQKADYARMARARELALQQLEVDRAEMRRKLAGAREIIAYLQDHKEDVLYEISRYRPFAVCPVAGPVAIADDFGIWVHRSEKRGGDHIHQGNDMMAAAGTPIVAPFDGTAVVATNTIGGQAVKVFGKYGYVYNAHLSRFGQLGPVQAGDVIGYVGNTGNTDANHDHFEWHPGGGPAVDPHGFLLRVC
jgi:murein DD-endopeptidase MepM/ murein hydrolase activator NlpD